MKSMWFKKERDGVEHFWRCGVCKADRGFSAVGVELRFGNLLVALVCRGECFERALLGIEQAAPHSFPELDADGVVLGGSKPESIRAHDRTWSKERGWPNG